MILGKYGQIGNKEQVIEELNSAGLAMRLEDGHIVDMMMLVTLVELQNLLVHIWLGVRWETLPTGRRHGSLIEGRCGPRDMSPADHRIVGPRPAKDVRELHGEERRMIVSSRGEGSECDFQADLRVKAMYGRNEGKRNDKQKNEDKLNMTLFWIAQMAALYEPDKGGVLRAFTMGAKES